MEWLNKTVSFFKKDLWLNRGERMPWWKRALMNMLKVVILTVKAFFSNRLFRMAAALTYSTLLAIVPIAAVVFAVARGFNFSIYIEEWFRDALASQPQVADAIIGFVNSYLVHAQSGIILGVGLVFMLVTVILLTTTIEESFNDIWHVDKPRTWGRTIINSTAVFFLLPIVIIVTSGVSVVFATISDHLREVIFVAPMVKVAVGLAPYVIWSLAFILLYVYMPNTRVRWRYAIVPGIIAGVAMQMLQLFYIHSQMWVSSYNAIYGSFAALPLFMLWLQISWTICMVGAQMCYVRQHLKDMAFEHDVAEISHHHQMIMAALLLSIICKRHYNGEQAYNVRQLKEQSGLPMRVTTELLRLLQMTGLIHTSGAYHEEDTIYQPSVGTNNITLGMMIERLEGQGTWKPRVLVAQLDGQLWRKVHQIRNDYCNELKTVLVRDL